jgi:hypothetical protein
VGGPAPPGNVDPVYQYLHLGQPGDSAFQGNSVTGGYVYRGPIAELQGRYFFADAVSGNVWSFDPADPAGTVRNMNLELTPDEGSIISITSFGEDEQGNLLLVDGIGQLFQIVANIPITLTINRESGAMTLANDSPAPIGVKGYSISSAVGSIDSASLIPITGNFDAPPGGNGSFDPNDNWQITSLAGSHEGFAESSLGDGGQLTAGGQISLSSSNGWIPSPTEDMTLSVTLADGTTARGSVEFVGNDGEAFSRSDLSFDGELNIKDWVTFTAHHLGNLSGLSNAQQYGRGDLDGDGDNDFIDFRIFQTDFDAANGPGALARLIAVPEPQGLLIAALGGLMALAGHRIGSKEERKETL